MTFQSPLALLALLALPLAVAGYVLVERRRGRVAHRFSSPALLPNVVERSPGRRRHLPAAIALAALAALLVALARPEVTLSKPREEATVALAIDTSRSMAANDVRPTRLAAAQAAASVFIEELPEKFRVGIVSFASGVHVATPPTTNRELALTALRSLRTGEGTALGDAIGRALEFRGSSRPEEEGIPMAILMLSDGAQTQGRLRPLEAAQRARRVRVPVHTVALGTPNGVVERPLPGGLRERITVPPDPGTLLRIAQTTGGEFFSAPDAEELKKVYRELRSRLGREDEEEEVTFAFVGGGALLMFAAGALSALWFQRLP